MDIGMDDCKDPDDLPFHQMFSGMNQLVSISSYASKLHAGIATAEDGPNEVQDVTTTHSVMNTVKVLGNGLMMK